MRMQSMGDCVVAITPPPPDLLSLSFCSLHCILQTKELIPGIGHKIKSLEDPDARVALVKSFVHQHFKSGGADVFNFACEVTMEGGKKREADVERKARVSDDTHFS